MFVTELHILLVFRPLLLNTNGAQKKNLFQHIVKEPTDNHHHKVIFQSESILYLLCQTKFYYGSVSCIQISVVNNNSSVHPTALLNCDTFYYLLQIIVRNKSSQIQLFQLPVSKFFSLPLSCLTSLLSLLTLEVVTILNQYLSFSWPFCMSESRSSTWYYFAYI